MDDTVQGDIPAAQLTSFMKLKPPAHFFYSYPYSVNTPSDAPDAPTLNFNDRQLQIRRNNSKSVLRIVVKVQRDAYGDWRDTACSAEDLPHRPPLWGRWIQSVHQPERDGFPGKSNAFPLLRPLS